ncbi:hypothetical protein ACWGJ2_19735 [Streptomyces sp. NPDC054796]
MHVVGGYFVLYAYLRRSQGAWDVGVTRTVRAVATVGVLTELLAFGLTVAFIGLAGLRRWWYALPGALILLAVARLIFAPSP